MMRRAILFFLLAFLASCDQSGVPKSKSNMLTVDELAANPERLKQLRQQCKTDRQNLGDMLCNRVAEATKRRFFGDGKVPYTPQETPPKF